MKLKKKSGLMGAVIALSCASLVSVGFASWVISQGATEAVSGTIAVDNVTDKSYSFSDWTNGTESAGTFTLASTQRIVFGSAAYDAEKAGVASYDWLRNDGKLQGVEGDSSAENLTASFTFKIKSNNADVAASAAGPAASLALDDGLGYAVSVSAITPSSAWQTTFHERALLGALQQPTLSYSAGVYTCNIAFAWGSYFTVNGNVVNPMTYFNSKNPATNAGIAAEATQVLQDLDDFLDGMTYNLTLTIAKAA